MEEEAEEARALIVVGLVVVDRRLQVRCLVVVVVG